jgi:ABC-type multidrug transport system fused ATPase/permease subunit
MNKKQLSTIWNLLKGGRGLQSKSLLFFGLMWILLISITPALSPLALREAVNNLALKQFTPAVYAIGLYVCAFLIIRAADAQLVFYFGHFWRPLRTKVARDAYVHLLRMPSQFYLSQKTGESIKIVSDGLGGLRSAFASLIFVIVPTVIQAMVILFVLLSMHRFELLLILLFLGICYGLIFYQAIGKRFVLQRRAEQADISAVGIASDALAGQELSKLINGADVISRRIDAALIESEVSWMKFFRSQNRDQLLLASLIAIVTCGYLIFTARQIVFGPLTTGDFVLANAYILQIIFPIERLGAASRDLSQAAASLTFFAELLEREPEEADYPKGQLLSGAHPLTVEMDQVVFGYDPASPIIKDVSLRIEPGKRVAIVGASGAGKSTVWRLMCRLYRPQCGKILFDGMPIDDLAIGSLRDAIAVVPQDTYLFNDTIANNILIGSPRCSRKEVEEAGSRAGLDQIVSSLAQGWDTYVGERGIRLSGGEKQRVAIARAFLRRPRLFIFDEATSALDSRAEHEMEHLLLKEAGEVSVLMIAHRLSTIRNADEIIVLENGKVIERGRHEFLLACRGRYSDMWAAQA